jgi:hypothetical protein
MKYNGSNDPSPAFFETEKEALEFAERHQETLKEREKDAVRTRTTYNIVDDRINKGHPQD